MRLLVIGGTRFVGRHLVEAALERGHSITLFHRGQSNPDLFPHVEHIFGNRDDGLDALPDRKWDAVIDTCGYVPRVVRQSAEALVGQTDRYVFISSVSVYRDDNPIGMDEDSPVATIADETVETITNETYGALKVLCEKVVQQVYANRATIVRPGLIVGPHDQSDRFTYWPYRLSQGGEVLAPGNPEQQIQVIDVRDLGEWLVRLVEDQRPGVYNAVGPDYTLSMRRFLETCVAVCNHDAQLTWVSEEFLIERHVQPFLDLPVWVEAKEAAIDTISNRRALAAGLKIRPLTETIKDTLDWANTRPIDHAWRNGLTREREAELLKQWHQRQ
ncbi:MAG: SDR family oxidoreductase [Anaerolineae bacterium]